MKRYALFLLVNICYFNLRSQTAILAKPPIDSSIIKRWQMPSYPKLSDNGSFVVYSITNLPYKGSTLIVKSTTNGWESSIPNVYTGNAFFTDNSKFLVCLNKIGVLSIIELGTENIRRIENIREFKIVNNEFILFRYLDSSLKVIIKNFKTNEKHELDNIDKYYLSPNGRDILIQSANNKASNANEVLEIIKIDNWARYKIWEGARSSNYTFDISGNKLAFLSTDRVSQYVWIYDSLENARVILKKSDDSEAMMIDNIQHFSKDANRLFIGLKVKKDTFVKENDVKLHIWSYSDSKLQSQQLSEYENIRVFTGVVKIDSQKLIRLEQNDDKVVSLAGNDWDDIAMVVNYEGDYGGEWNWNRHARKKVFIVSTIDGSRTSVNLSYQKYNNFNFNITPLGKYIIFFDAFSKNYFSYEISTKSLRNITLGIKATWVTRNDEPTVVPNGIGAISKTDDFILLYDRYDIYMVDPAGKAPPINLTNGYGNKNKVVFRMAMSEFGIQTLVINKTDTLLLNAFNYKNKFNGFFTLNISERHDPLFLTMSPNIYVGPGVGESTELLCNAPIKAKNCNSYIITKESATTSKDFYYTSDFIKYRQISDVHPERDVNWLTAELVKWKTFDGTISEGILYKPENFNPRVKYPIIFTYYEKFSECLNQFIAPALSDGRINIPYFVSNGYIVFVPDIHYTIGKPGESSYNSVVSAADYFKNKVWVNRLRMGILGHSFGGFETNYIITKTNIFAAAMSSSGMSDFISAYGSIIGGGYSRQHQYEIYRDRIGSSLWAGPNLYVKNSPILNADKIRTPLLMMNNKDDDDVPFSQGIELFTGLRRLGKKVWMLQYDGQGHVLLDDVTSYDYTNRVKQFFDYYLRDSTIPLWMAKPKLANKEGIDNLFELEPRETDPYPNLLYPFPGNQRKKLRANW